MRAPRIIVRAALVCGATGIALGVWAASDDHAAHASDKRPAAEQPGGLLGATVRLPEQAAGRAKQAVAKQAVAKVTARVPAPVDEPTEDQAETPEPAPPADPPIELPPVELPPVLDPPPVVVEPAPVELPLPLPPIEELPPAPLPTTPVELPDTPGSLPATAPVVVPGALPGALGPVPAAVPPPPAATAVDLAVSDTAAQVIPCETSHNHAAQGGRDNADRQTGKPAPSVHDRKPCQPQRPATDTTGPGQVKPPPPSSAETVVGDLDRSHVPPALGRLEHARARSSIPASRTTHPEPGPA